MHEAQLHAIQVYLQFREYQKQADPHHLKSSDNRLKLQKLLYYIQGLSLCIYGKPAFNNKIVAWSYGPVVEDVYYKYKDKGKRSLATPKDVKRISDGLSNIIDIVIEGYGKYSAISLMELTHKEIPWKNTEKTMEITQDVIKSYFDRVYAK